MTIHQNQMNAEQQAAVAQKMADLLEPRNDESYPMVRPLVQGVTRISRSGALWANFPAAGTQPLQKRAHWFRLVDADHAASLPFHIVLTEEGAPLGDGDGVLIVQQLKGRWQALVINTGYNYDDEIEWAA